MKFWDRFLEKLNPAQGLIYRDEGAEHSSTQNSIRTIQNAYDMVEVVNRCVNFIVDNNAMLDYDVSDSLGFTGLVTGVRQKTLSVLLNNRPNPYMDISTFRRLCIMDFVVEGNCFIHFDGSSLYHLPAINMKIVADEKHYINHYVYDEATIFKPNEVIHVKDNSVSSIFRGDSRLNCNLESLYTRDFMTLYQKNFFKNGTAVGLIVESENTLNKKMRDRQEKEWISKYNPAGGGNGKPLILDSGLKAKMLTNSNFKDHQFNESVESLENKTCVALGIPPILLDSGNNANIKPNLELYFYTTGIPMMRKLESAIEHFFAYDIEIGTHRVPALKPDQKAESERLSSLVNNGIMTGNEARTILRMEPIEDDNMKKIRIPANVAGSGTGVTGQEGGKPAGENNG